jgi:hypothetical protein
MRESVRARVVTFLYFALAILTIMFSPSSSFAATPTFQVGEEVATTGTTNVRATADGSLVGTQPRYATGDIAAGPVTVSGNSVTWYKVTFFSGPSGWVGVDMLIGGLPAPKSVIVGQGENFFALVLDEFGNIEVPFISSFDSNHNAIYSFSESTNQGLTFSTPTVLPMSALFQVPPPGGPQVAAERNGAIDIVYTCPTRSCQAGNTSVEMIRSTNHGATWSAPIQISVPPRGPDSGAGSPVVSACGAGVTIAWLDDGVGARTGPTTEIDVFVMQVVNGVPGTPINVTNFPGGAFAQIAVNPQGTIYLSWFGGTSVNFASIPNCAAVQQ